jgi:hypothetical protein
MVGPMRFELMASAMSRRRHNQLDHGPNKAKYSYAISDIKVSLENVKRGWQKAYSQPSKLYCLLALIIVHSRSSPI